MQFGDFHFGEGPQSWIDIATGTVALVLLVGGSMLWVKWRSKHRELTTKRDG